MQRDYALYKHLFRGQRMPFAYVDLDLFDHNIQHVLERSGTKRLRLASKSIRSVAMLQRIFAADARFQGIMCYTAREAVWLASQGFEDLLIGYPIWNAEDIGAVAESIANGGQITLMVDSVAHIDQIAAIAQRHEVTIPVCIEIDMSIDVPGLHFGVWRSPLRTPAQTRPVIDHILATRHVLLDGIMGYESQIAGLGDRLPGKRMQNMVVQALKQRSIGAVAARRAAILTLIASYGHALRFVNGGGTGSLATTREEPGVTEITVGSAFYGPALFDHYRDFRFLPAAGYTIEIVRQSRSDLYICLGGGYIASGAIGPEKQPMPYLPQGAQLLAREGAGEVQTPIRYTGPEKLALGDPIFMRHSKAGEVCEHFTHLALLTTAGITGETTTYRGAGQVFL